MILVSRSQRGKVRRKTGPVLERFELGLGISVVIRRVRPGKGLRHFQINEQLGDGFGLHGRPPVRMQSELLRLDTLPLAGGGNQNFSQLGALGFGQQPADHKAAVDIQDDVQVVMLPFGRPLKFGDVPTPQLPGTGGFQLRFGGRRVSGFRPTG